MHAGAPVISGLATRAFLHRLADASMSPREVAPKLLLSRRDPNSKEMHDSKAHSQAHSRHELKKERKKKSNKTFAHFVFYR